MQKFTGTDPHTSFWEALEGWKRRGRARPGGRDRTSIPAGILGAPTMRNTMILIRQKRKIDESNLTKTFRPLMTFNLLHKLCLARKFSLRLKNSI